MSEKVIKRAGEVIAAKTAETDGYATLALIDENGYPTASTVSTVKADGINWLAFCASLDDNKANRIRKCNRASVCINSNEYNITLVGTMEILTDSEIKKEMWREGFENHWSGSDDPNYCVLRFSTERYNLFVGWESATGTL